MASQILQTEEPEEPEQRALDTIVGGGTAVEAIAGLGAGVVAILGLAGVLPFYMTSVGVIAAGVALLVEGVSVRSAYAKVAHDYAWMTDRVDVDTAGGMRAQSLGGATAIVLGILALVGVLPAVLLAVAAMALGGGLLFGGPARAELNWSEVEFHHPTDSSRRLVSRAFQGSAGMLSLFGIGAFILGILALAQVGSPATALTLILVAVLAIGATELIGDCVMIGRLAVARRH